MEHIVESSSDLAFHRLLDDDIFTFLVGPNKRAFRIHVSALSRISEPLAHMMTDGNMKESIEKEAVLDDIEPVAFARLAKFAYFGVYGIADAVSTKCTPATSDSPKGETCRPGGFRCLLCADVVTMPLHSLQYYPFCSLRHMNSKQQYASNDMRHCIHCIVQDCTKSWTDSDPSHKWLCQDHIRSHQNIYGSPRHPIIFRDSKSIQRVGAFESHQYPCASLTHAGLDTIINNYQSIAPAGIMPHRLVEHAHLYCLADRYLVPELPATCSHNLHRDLVAFKIAGDSVEDLADLLLYAYGHTSDDGNILDGSCDPLRNLIMAYLVENSAILMKHKGFREILLAGGLHTADYMALTFVGKASA